MIRPIADMGDYTAEHWRDVGNVVTEALDEIGWDLRLVSESDGVNVILTQIVTNLYQDRIVVADVSGRNPNVMFELGMRMAFEKPAVIITDDITPFTFDISPVKHIKYPRALRYADIVKFKKELGKAILVTLETAEAEGYRGYLQQFGPVQVTTLGANNLEVSDIAQDVVEIRRIVSGILSKQSAAEGTAPKASFKLRYPGSSIDRPIISDMTAEFGLDVPQSVIDQLNAVDGISRLLADDNKLFISFRSVNRMINPTETLDKVVSIVQSSGGVLRLS